MPRMRGTTKKTQGSSRQGSSAPQSPLQLERVCPDAPVYQTRSVRQKTVHGKGKGPAPETESEGSSKERSGEETGSELEVQARARS